MEGQIAVGDEHPALALDDDDEGLAGDVQVPDALAVPGVVLAQLQLLQLDVVLVAAAHRLGPQHQHVVGHQLPGGPPPRAPAGWPPR